MLKKLVFTVFLVNFAVFVCWAGGKAEKSAPPPEVPGDADISYAFGVVLGSDLKQTGLAFNYDTLMQGITDSLEGREPRLTMEEAIAKIQAAYTEAMAKKAEENKQKELQFLSENGKKPGVITTASGLQYEVISEGSGARPAPSDTVRVNYEGALTDGTVFDSSYEAGEPVEFALSDVIPGWTEGIQLMREGGSYRLFIPSALAYGERGAGNFIPPYSALIFNVELLSIVK
jgi:FKBP-type peptidyl-prolyl cis-trans isomerase FkpA